MAPVEVTPDIPDDSFYPDSCSGPLLGVRCTVLANGAVALLYGGEDCFNQYQAVVTQTDGNQVLIRMGGRPQLSRRPGGGSAVDVHGLPAGSTTGRPGPDLAGGHHVPTGPTISA